MKSRIVLFISLLLTAFALVTIGGVITSVRGAGQVPETAMPTEEVAVSPTADPAIQETFSQREQAYQELIAQANARLEEAQKTQLALQAQLDALQNANATTAEATAITITPEEAASLAAQHMGRADLFSVETSILYGNTVYKVVFSSGDIVYVSLDGQIIGVAPAPVVSASQGGSGGGGGGGWSGNQSEDHEHEEHEYEDGDD